MTNFPMHVSSFTHTKAHLLGSGARAAAQRRDVLLAAQHLQQASRGVCRYAKALCLRARVLARARACVRARCMPGAFARMHVRFMLGAGVKQLSGKTHIDSITFRLSVCLLLPPLCHLRCCGCCSRPKKRNKTLARRTAADIVRGDCGGERQLCAALPAPAARLGRGLLGRRRAALRLLRRQPHRYGHLPKLALHCVPLCACMRACNRASARACN